MLESPSSPIWRVDCHCLSRPFGILLEKWPLHGMFLGGSGETLSSRQHAVHQNSI